MDARLIFVAGCLALAGAPALAQDFDQSHAAWGALLRKYVVVLPGEHASQVRYDGFAADRKEIGRAHV